MAGSGNEGNSDLYEEEEKKKDQRIIRIKEPGAAFIITMMIKKILVNLTVCSNDSLGCMSQASKVEVNLSKLE